MSDNEPICYAVETEDFRKLKAIAARLCGGSDRMRDEGNLMHLLLVRAEEFPIHAHDLKEKL